MRKPFYLQFIKYFYLFLTALVIIVPLKYGVLKFTPALVLMWLTYFAFKKGINSHRCESVVADYKVTEDRIKNKMLVFFVLFMVIFIPAYINFYTGGNPLVLLMNFGQMTGADSNYAAYQLYAEEQGIATFSMAKLPYIVLNGIATFFFVYFCLYIIAFKTKKTFWQFFLLFVLFFLYFLKGISRGTSFENFELLIVLLFCIAAGRKIKNNKNFYSRKQIIAVGLLAFVGVIYFTFSMSMRSDQGISMKGPTSSLLYDSSSWVMAIAPGLGRMALGLSGYFVFPLYFTSEVFWHIWTTSFEGFTASVLPFTAEAFYHDARSYGMTLEKLYGVDRGMCWVPDIINIIYIVGIPLFLYFVYLIGRYSRTCYKKGIIDGDLSGMMLLYFITYEMISLPVGNFIMTASNNQIAVLLTIIVFLMHGMKKYKFVRT